MITIDNRAPYGIELRNVQWVKKSKSYNFLKRIFDLTVSTVSLVLYLPVLLSIALLIRATSKGPSLMLFQRAGQYGIPFHVVKFRTFLITSQEQENVPVYTPLGRLLRKYGLQELPMLINVFLGNMSLVGPRPLLQRELDFLNSETIQRLSVKPGITGLAQISHDYDRALDLDVEYARTSKFTLDLKILWRTILIVLKNPNDNPQ